LKWILNRVCGRALDSFMWTAARLFEQRNEASGHVNGGEFLVEVYGCF